MGLVHQQQSSQGEATNQSVQMMQQDSREQHERGSLQANVSLEEAVLFANASTMPHGRAYNALSEKEKKMQFVQYECIKNELKVEYEKKVNFLHKRLNKKAQMDPSFLLLNNMTQGSMSTKNQRPGEDTLF